MRLARHLLGQVLLVFIANTAAGLLGLQLALPPGYATLIWPPAGVALVAMLRMGPSAIAGVLPATLLLNTLIASGHFTRRLDLIALGMVLAIGLGSTLQAWLGARWVRAHASFPNPLARPRHVAQFMVWGGLLPCVVGATVGSTALWSSGQLTAAALPQTWLTWYLGDTMAVFLLSPALLLWLHGQGRGDRQRLLRVLLSLGVTLGLTAAATLQTQDSDQRGWHQRFSEEMAAGTAQLQRALQSEFNAVAAMEALLTSHQQSERDLFDRFAARMVARNTAIAALEWVPRVRADQAQAFEIWWRDASGYAGFHLKPAYDGHGADLFPVSFAYPLVGNEGAIGFNLGSNPARLRALEQARDSGGIAITERIRLVQDRKPAVLAALPLYDIEAPDTAGPDWRAAHLSGFALGVVRLDPLIGPALSTAGQRASIQVLDLTQSDKPVRLWSNTAAVSGDTGDARITPPTPQATVYALDVGGRRWELRAEPGPFYAAQAAGGKAWLVLLAGLLLSGTLALIMLVVSGQDLWLRGLVEERTHALALSEERLQVALQASGTGLWDWFPAQGLEVYSDTWYRMLGYEPDAGPTHYQELIHPDEREQVKQVMQDALHGRTAVLDLELRLRHADGHWLWVHLRGRVVERDASGRPLRFSGAQVDVSAARQVQEALAAARDRAIAADQAKTAFLAAVSHELRTPLTSIRGLSELMEMRSEKASQREQAGVIRRASEQLTELLDEILDLAKLEAGAMGIVEERVDPRELLRFSAELFRPAAEAKGLALRWSIAEAVPPALMGDGLRIKQILNNLLSNAVKFTEHGHIELNAQRDGERLLISVRDTGSGIPDALHETVFEKFRQADDRVSHQHGGTGLGLALVKALVERMGGEIRLHSAPGEGSEFLVTLPIRLPATA